MKLAATLVLALSVPSTVLAAPKLKLPPQSAASPAATAATARIAERNIPKVVKSAKPKPVDLGSILPKAMTVNPALPKPAKPAAVTEPVLTAEELAVDVVELTPQSLHSPQVGTSIAGLLETYGRMVGIWVHPSVGPVSFGASAQWISGHTLLVECPGMFNEPEKIRLWRNIAAKNEWELVGSLTIDHGGDMLAFVVPKTALSGWDRLVIMISDADYEGYPARIDKCTFTRL